MYIFLYNDRKDDKNDDKNDDKKDDKKMNICVMRFQAYSYFLDNFKITSFP